MKQFKHIGLFEAIAGFSLAARWMGWQTIATCEINDFCNKILKYHFPNATQHYDIKQTDFTIYRGKCDILTGGFPCQPFSLAGKRKGTEDDRHLFPEMLRAIREIQPTWIVGENVFGIVNWDGGLVFEQVQADLEAEGYEVQSFILPAASVNAPHRRDRVWFVAYSSSNGQQRSNSQHEINTSERGINALNDIKQVVTSDTESIGRSERIRERINSCGWKTEKHFTKRNYIRNWNKTISGTGVFTDTTSERLQRRIWWNSKRKRFMFCFKNITPDTNRNDERLLCRQKSKQVFKTYSFNSNFSRYELTSNSNSRRQSGKEYRKTKSGQFTEKSMPGNWQNFPTQPPICGGNDGIPRKLDAITFPKWRNESIKAYGNAIVPQVALQIFKAIEQYELNNNTK